MKKFYLFALLFTSLTGFSQKSGSQCAAAKSHAVHAKSGSLTIAQIAQTERYDVHYYALDLQMTNTSTTLSGTAEMHGTARETLDSVWYELFQDFTITEIRLNGNPVAFVRSGSAIKVPVNLAAGAAFEIATDYNGTPPTAVTNPLGGAGMSNDSDSFWGNQVTWSLSEPFSAYEWWPCKQSLKDKADSVSVKVTVPSACKAGSNGVLENTVDLGNGFTRYEWKHRHPVDYYLISVSVAQYVEYNIYANPAGAVNPILVQNFVYDNPQTLSFFQTDIDETVDFIEYYSQIYGLYPFDNEKYGHCMAPLGGGMEHQTMTTLGFFEATLTAHELAHQWWGDHVTCNSWADIWVNEGFAAYSEYLMLAALHAPSEVTDMSNRHQNVMSSPDGSVWVEDSLSDSRIFSERLTYNKGASIIHTMRFVMNDDVQFFQALRNYQQHFADSTAAGTDMQAELEAISGIDYAPVFEQWYFGEGFPTYSASWNMVGNNLHLRLTHIASMPQITPTFTNPLEVKFVRTGLPDTIVRFEISGNVSDFIMPGIGNVTNISEIDPNNWIINQTGPIQHEPTLDLACVEEISGSESFRIFPNPAQDLVNVQMNDMGTYTLRIIDPRGKSVLEKVFTGETQIDLSNYAHGIYVFQLKAAGGNSKSYKLVRR